MPGPLGWGVRLGGRIKPFKILQQLLEPVCEIIVARLVVQSYTKGVSAAAVAHATPPSALGLSFPPRFAPPAMSGHFAETPQQLPPGARTVVQIL